MVKIEKTVNLVHLRKTRESLFRFHSFKYLANVYVQRVPRGVLRLDGGGGMAQTVPQHPGRATGQVSLYLSE